LECCIRQLWCSSVILYNITSIAYNPHTDIYSLLNNKHINNKYINIKTLYLHYCSEKIKAIASKGDFREGDFIRGVQKLVGDDGSAYCRAMLDAITATINGNGSGGNMDDSQENSLESRVQDSAKRLLHSKVFEGRCR